MLKRIMSAGMLIVFISAVALLSIKLTLFIDLFVSIVCAVSVFEFCKAVKTLGIFQISILSIAYAFILPITLAYDISLIVSYAYTILMLAMLIFFHDKISFKNFAYTYSMTLIITVSMSLIVMMSNMHQDYSTMYFILSLAIPWLADVGAYFTGVFFGKHKLCPKISPKKTIEGAVGGVLFCILSSVILGFLFNILFYSNSLDINYIALVIIGAVGSLLSILGDLSFSVIKRSYFVKDYGDVIPGHGGILDRFDSVICFAPFMYIVTMYFPIVLK